MPWTHGTRSGILAGRTLDGRGRGARGTAAESFVKEAVEVGEGVERLGEERE